MSTPPTATPATVYLVGAGPGDPGLITARGIACLGLADVVLYDYLANPALLRHAPPSAERVPLGRHGSGRDLTNEAIVERMVAEAHAGRTVVRLKGGDPSVFGRAADETEALRDAGIPYEIVPGITAGLAVAATCEIPVTHHADASAIALIAAQERHEKEQSTIDYAGLAAFPGTLVFYMGVGSVMAWSRVLIEHGKAPDTPVAVVRWGTWARQRMHTCTLESVADVVEREDIRPPAIFVVGPVVRRAPPVSWFAGRPLFGTRILVAGSPGVSEALRHRLAALGADVLAHPAIRIADPPDWAPVDEALDRLDEYDWLAFSSANGVDYLFRRLRELGGDLRRLGRAKLAAMGSGTAARLAHYHLQADVVPEEFVAESLAQALVDDAGGRRFLLARASRGRSVLAEALRAAGGLVDEVVVYDSIDVTDADADVAEALGSGAVDWVTVGSSATVRSLARLYGDALRGARFASIGPITSAALRALGYDVTVEAMPHSTEGLVQAILDAAAAAG